MADGGNLYDAFQKSLKTIQTIDLKSGPRDFITKAIFPCIEAFCNFVVKKLKMDPSILFSDGTRRIVFEVIEAAFMGHKDVSIAISRTAEDPFPALYQWFADNLKSSDDLREPNGSLVSKVWGFFTRTKTNIDLPVVSFLQCFNSYCKKRLVIPFDAQLLVELKPFYIEAWTLSLDDFFDQEEEEALAALGNYVLGGIAYAPFYNMVDEDVGERVKGYKDMILASTKWPSLQMDVWRTLEAFFGYKPLSPGLGLIGESPFKSPASLQFLKTLGATGLPQNIDDANLDLLLQATLLTTNLDRLPLTTCIRMVGTSQTFHLLQQSTTVFPEHLRALALETLELPAGPAHATCFFPINTAPKTTKFAKELTDRARASRPASFHWTMLVASVAIAKDDKQTWTFAYFDALQQETTPFPSGIGSLCAALGGDSSKKETIHRGLVGVGQTQAECGIFAATVAYAYCKAADLTKEALASDIDKRLSKSGVTRMALKLSGKTLRLFESFDNDAFPSINPKLERYAPIYQQLLKYAVWPDKTLVTLFTCYTQFTQTPFDKTQEIEQQFVISLLGIFYKYVPPDTDAWDYLLALETRAVSYKTWPFLPGFITHFETDRQQLLVHAIMTAKLGVDLAGPLDAEQMSDIYERVVKCFNQFAVTAPLALLRYCACVCAASVLPAARQTQRLYGPVLMQQIEKLLRKDMSYIQVNLDLPLDIEKEFTREKLSAHYGRYVLAQVVLHYLSSKKQGGDSKPAPVRPAVVVVQPPRKPNPVPIMVAPSLRNPAAPAPLPAPSKNPMYNLYQQRKAGIDARLRLQEEEAKAKGKTQ